MGSAPLIQKWAQLVHKMNSCKTHVLQVGAVNPEVSQVWHQLWSVRDKVENSLDVVGGQNSE